jgi:hypothetical protein
MEKTAMQLAIEHYEDLSLNGSNQAYVIAKFLKDNFLEMEKEQIIKAAADHCYPTCELAEIDAVDYYNKTFKS